MPRKLHPADIANAAIAANAVRFDLALFLGVGRYARASAATLAEARREAVRLTANHPNGRRALIYAIDASGRSALVTDDASPQPKEPAMKTYSKKFNAQRAAKAAGHCPEEIEIVTTEGGFTWRLKAKPTGAADARDATLVPGAPREPQRANTAKPERPTGKRAQIEADARAGKVPQPPDFSAETHKRFRNKLQSVIDLAKAGDLKGLSKFEINPVSSSPKAIARYRDLCIIALEAQGTR